jgi:hypothetical protein
MVHSVPLYPKEKKNRLSLPVIDFVYFLNVKIRVWIQNVVAYWVVKYWLDIGSLSWLLSKQWAMTTRCIPLTWWQWIGIVLKSWRSPIASNDRDFSKPVQGSEVTACIDCVTTWRHRTYNTVMKSPASIAWYNCHWVVVVHNRDLSMLPWVTRLID